MTTHPRCVTRTGRLKKMAVLMAALLLASCASKPPKSLVTPNPPVSKQPLPDGGLSQPQTMRGIWLATVSRLD